MNLAPEVAYDKLASFEHYWDLHRFFYEEGVLGYLGDNYWCPISTWLRFVTGMEVSCYAQELQIWEGEYERWKGQFFTPTQAMLEFMDRFDNGEFPELAADPDNSA